MDSLNHWTIMLELMLYEQYFDNSIIIFQTNDPSENPLEIEFDHNNFTVQDPFTRFDSNLIYNKWYEVYFTYKPVGDNDYELCVSIHQLYRDDETPESIIHECHSLGTEYIFTDSQYSIRVGGEPGMIVRSMAFYKFALSTDSLSYVDYVEASPYAQHTFSQVIESQYYPHMEAFNYFTLDEDNV